MRAFRLSNRQPVILSAELGGGGEGKIYAVAGEPSLVAKVYHTNQQTPDRGKKLLAMYANPPDDSFSIAWPVDLLGSGDRILGFLMRRVTESHPLHEIYNPKTRREKFRFFDYFYLHRTARNLAAATATLHNKGYVIGDVNESNILVSDRALVTLVDTDSFQVRDRRYRKTYRCPVGKPEFTPPELQGETFARIDRTPDHDVFGLTVLIFQLLMEGTHPFDGVYTGKGEPPAKEARIAAGHFPYSPHIFNYRPKPFAPPLSIVHPKVAQLFVRCFESGHINPKLRPSAKTWVEVLKEAEEELRECPHNPQHRYGQHLPTCPWCERAQKLGGRDPFPPKNPKPVSRRPVVAPPKPRTKPVVALPKLKIKFDPASLIPPRPQRPRRRINFNLANLLPLPIGVGAALVLMAVGDFSDFRRGYEEALDVAGETVNLLRDATDAGQCSPHIQKIWQNLPLRPQSSERLYRCQVDKAQELAGSGKLGLAIAAITELPAPLNQETEAVELVDGWSRQLLDEATQKYNAGQLNLALALAGDIPEMSSLFAAARDATEQWSREWMQNQTRLELARKAMNEERYYDAKKALERVTTPHWQEQALDIFDEIYAWEVQQALDGERFAEAKAAVAQITNPYRKQQAEQTIVWVEEAVVARKEDAENLEAARQALANGQFQEAKTRASQVESRTNESTARSIARHADTYGQLQTLLAAGDWDTASRRTRTQLLILARANVYCEDLILIDRLWSKYSQGEYGLSAQLRFKEREKIIGLGWENITPDQQIQLNKIYPSRPNLGSAGANLDARLKSCGL